VKNFREALGSGVRLTPEEGALYLIEIGHAEKHLQLSKEEATHLKRVLTTRIKTP